MNFASTRSVPSLLTFHAVAEIVGLLCLATALLLNALPSVGLSTMDATVLKAGLLACASGQVLAGLAAWRRHEPLPAVLLTAFGLFWFSRSAFALSAASAATGGAAAATSAVLLLFLWGGYALILACEAEKSRLPVRWTLGALAAALLLQALGEGYGGTLLLQMGGMAGLLAALAAGVAAVDRAAQLGAELSR